tara:strand:+ start:167 stop:850 length:684 start_codon:yes stop_codon:yes gene_type:complete
MAQSGIHAFSGIILSKYFKQQEWLAPSIMIGAMLPDIDIVFSAFAFILGKSIEGSELIFHRTFTHSIFTVIATYLVFLCIAEIKSDTKFRIIGKGVCMGILLHIILDLLFWFKGVRLFWPLPADPINLWNFNLPELFFKIIFSLEFILFRIYGWYLINSFIKYPANQGWFIKYISRWINIEFILFVISVAYIYLNIPGYKIFFTIMYIPSLVMALISTYILREIFNH